MPTLAEISEQIKDLQKEYQKQSRELFTKATQSLFEEHPTLKAFGWSQGTPGFCDGDPCYFQIRAEENNLELIFTEEATQELLANGIHYDIERGDDVVFNALNFDYWYYRERTLPDDYLQTYDDLADSITKFIYSTSEDMLLSMFGDGVKVLIYRDGRTELDDTYFE